MAEGEGPGAVSVSWAAVGTAPSQYDGAEAAPQITDEFRVFLDHIGLRAATVPPILRTLELCEVTSLDTWLGLDAEEMREVREELRAAGVSVGTRYMLRTEISAATVGAWRAAAGGLSTLAGRRSAAAAKPAPPATAEGGRRRMPQPPRDGPAGHAPLRLVPPAARAAAAVDAAKAAVDAAKAAAAPPIARVAKGGFAIPPPPPASRQPQIVDAKAVAPSSSAAASKPSSLLAGWDCPACRGRHVKHTCSKRKPDPEPDRREAKRPATAAAVHPRPPGSDQPEPKGKETQQRAGWLPGGPRREREARQQQPSQPLPLPLPLPAAQPAKESQRRKQQAPKRVEQTQPPVRKPRETTPSSPGDETLERNIRQWKAVQLEGALGPVWRSTKHELMDRKMVTLSRFDRLRTILLKKHLCCRNRQAALRRAQDVRVERRRRADGRRGPVQDEGGLGDADEDRGQDRLHGARPAAHQQPTQAHATQLLSSALLGNV